LLREFLGKPVPAVPFPHLNESHSLKKVFEAMGVKAIKDSLWNFAIVGVFIAVVVVAIRWAVTRQ
jgi:hypothetical protein